MDTADEIDWQGDSQERFVERVVEIEAWGIYNGNVDLGKRYADEVLEKFQGRRRLQESVDSWD